MSLKIALERAEKGLAWLKESGPIHGLDVNAVDLDTLDLGDDCQCVLGQLGREYEQIIDRLDDAGVINGQPATWPVQHGFMENGWANFDELTVAWKLLLTNDREQQ